MNVEIKTKAVIISGGTPKLGSYEEDVVKKGLILCLEGYPIGL